MQRPARVDSYTFPPPRPTTRGNIVHVQLGPPGGERHAYLQHGNPILAPLAIAREDLAAQEIQIMPAPGPDASRQATTPEP